MNVQELRDEIERRVQEQLPVALFEKGVKSHAKHSFRLGCSCSFCIIKREATLTIGSANRYPVVRISLAWGDNYYELMRERKKAVRNKLRKDYSERMTDALAEL